MKFNTLLKNKINKPNTINLAGGQAHQMSDKLELVTILLTSFLDKQYYRNENAAAKRLTQLVAKIPDKQFIAKAALYARREAGMRSVSHLIAGEIAHNVKGEEWTKRFFDRVVFRVDDVLEILAYYLAVYGKPLPNSLKKGLGQALTRFDDYQLAKYRRGSASLNLVDAVNLVHPPHTPAIRRLIDGSLAPAGTWETKLTQAGQTAESDKDKAEQKGAVWTELIRERRIGYFALLRNLRNILVQAPEMIDEAITLLTDKTLIRRSLVMPFRYRAALDAIEDAPALDQPVLKAAIDRVFKGGADIRALRQKVITALNVAVDHSLNNVPRFKGRTLIAMDCSGSMIGKPMKVGSLFSAVLYKVNDADLMLFSGDARYVTYNRDDATLTIAQRIEDSAEWSGTNFHSIFERARTAYDRVIILSDMQAWMNHWTPVVPFERFVKKTGKRPHVYSFDLAGYGSIQFPENKVYTLSGFSDKTMETLRFLEQDKSALIHEIEKIEL